MRRQRWSAGPATSRRCAMQLNPSQQCDAAAWILPSMFHLPVTSGAVPQAEGSPWRAMALLVAGGQLHAAATVLRDAGAVDAAYGLATACREACAEAGLAKQVGAVIDSRRSSVRNAQCSVRPQI